MSTDKHTTDCVRISIIGDIDTKRDNLKDYNEYIEISGYISAGCHVIILLFVLVFFIITCIRKHRISAMQWAYLIQICVV